MNILYTFHIFISGYVTDCRYFKVRVYKSKTKQNKKNTICNFYHD